MFGMFRRKSYTARLIGRSLIIYREGDRNLRINTELAIDGLIVYLGKVTGWEPPHESELFGEDDVARVAANIRDRFETKRTKVYRH